MGNAPLQILIAMCVYILVVIGIGFYFMKRSNKSSEEFLLGGRSLGPWVAAFSAEASDMSGWLLMGLPGVAYWMGISDAFWTALGLALGTYLNWLITAKRLRNYSVVAGNAITVPDYFSNRFREKRKVLLLISSLFILIFFTVYAASCFVTCGKLFSTLFGLDYRWMVVAGAVFVVFYTLVGGFLAESASDFMQAIVMCVSLIVVVVFGVAAAGGINQVMANTQNIPGFLEFFGIAQPTIENGVQAVQNGQAIFGPAGNYGALTIVSTMAWGLGYFGMPHVLLRFMAIRKPRELTRARRIGTIWCVISLAAAVLVGLIGRAWLPTALLTPSESETIFIAMSRTLFPPLLAGLVMAGILAATISSADSYLLISASSFSKNLYQGIFHKKASDKAVLWATRIVLVTLSVIAMVIAFDENSIIFQIVAFAWAGFGATFGPIMLFSLFWKRTTTL
ncbi:MAG: sodium/proline symporter, partial [Christensenellales bacterium]